MKCDCPGPYADDRSLIYGYTVRYKRSGAADSTYVATMVYPRPGQATGTVELTGLRNGTSYTVQIRSHNAVGVSRWLTIDFKDHTTLGQPTPELLVGNTGKANYEAGGIPTTTDAAQAFTTGSHAYGYKLTSVGWALKVNNPGAGDPTYTVSVHSVDSSGKPGTSLGTLNNPGSLADGVNTFTASGTGIDLDPSTTYFLVFKITANGSSGVRYLRTTFFAEDSGGADDWSIADELQYATRGQSDWQTNDGSALKISVTGYEK